MTEILYNGTFTIPSSGYLNIATGTEPFRGKAIISLNPITWGTNTGAFSLASSGGNEIYIIGANGTRVTNLKIRFTYMG